MNVSNGNLGVRITGHSFTGKNQHPLEVFARKKTKNPQKDYVIWMVY
jgi:hypothetical protein